MNCQRKWYRFQQVVFRSSNRYPFPLSSHAVFVNVLEAVPKGKNQNSVLKKMAFENTFNILWKRQRNDSNENLR